MTLLKDLSVDHPYYCSDSNYYSREAGAEWETMAEFLDEFEDADEDMNLVFRWDLGTRTDSGEDHGRYDASVFLMHQRKGLFSPHYIKHVNESEAERFKAYLEKHWKRLKEIWEPISISENKG